MKPLYKSIAIFCILLLVSLQGKSQLLNENFNGTLPTSWPQGPAGTWSLSPNLGISGSGCAFSQDLNVTMGTVTITTPTLNLTSVSNLTLTFNVALVGNNFIIPELALYYESGSVPQLQARWGSGFSPNTTHTVTGGYDYNPPLDAQNVWWISCTETISAISGTMTSFRFAAEFVNGGYVLIDEVVIAGKVIVTTGLTEKEDIIRISVFPNPTLDKKLKLEDRNIKTILISDANGRVLPADYTKTGDTFEIDLVKFPEGIYYLNAVSSDDTSIRKKILVE